MIARAESEAGRVALVVVHGIGNQPPGSAGEKVAQAIRNPGSAVRRREIASGIPIDDISVGGTQVTVCEAYWASSSHPDNPPRVQSALGAMKEVVETLKDSVVASVNPDGKGGCGCMALFYMALCGLAACTSTLVGLASGMADESSEPDCLDVTTIGLLAALGVHALWFVIQRRRRLGLGHGVARYRDLASDLLAVPLRIVGSVVVAGAIMLLLALCLLALPFNLLSKFVVLVLRGWGWLLGKLRLKWLSLWTYRLTWLFVVLPTHNCLQALRAFAMLLSVILTEESLAVRVRALVWIPAIMAVFRGLWFFTWRLVVPMFVIFLGGILAAAGIVEIMTVGEVEPGSPPTASQIEGVQGAAEPAAKADEEASGAIMVAFLAFMAAVAAIVSFSPDAVDWLLSMDVLTGSMAILAFFAIYALAIRYLLPVFDSLLDISNYHLSSAKRRATYFTQLDRALAALRAAGYEEVHLVAHSLGTVVAFDYLKLKTQPAGAITTFHTVGSPLNKFWFVDHEQWRRRDSGLAGWVTREWRNYWAWSDPVSGALQRFDAPALKVTNQRLRKLGPPLISHTAYWKSAEVVLSLRQALGAEESSQESSDQRPHGES